MQCNAHQSIHLRDGVLQDADSRDTLCLTTTRCVRFLDTTGSIAALIGLVIGITALFVDKYDLSFAPRGFLKDAVDAADDFVKAVDPLQRTLSSIWSADMLPTPLLAVQMYVPASSFSTLLIRSTGPFGIDHK